MSALHDLTVAQLARTLRSKEVSAVEVARHFLDRGALHEALGAYLAIDEDVTLAQARSADGLIAAGKEHWDSRDQNEAQSGRRQ